MPTVTDTFVVLADPGLFVVPAAAPDVFVVTWVPTTVVDLPADIGFPAGAVATDWSGAIITGGAHQQAMPANADRRGFIVYNMSADDLWIDVQGGVAMAGGASILLPAGASYTSDYGNMPTSAVSIFGPTTGQTFIVEEYV